MALASKRVRIPTRDGLTISATYWSKESTPRKECLVVGPGFASHSQLKEMIHVSGLLFKTIDVLCIDFRGNHESEGGYSFGGDEYLDLLSALDWARSKYVDLYLMGFSLGAYSALRAATHYGDEIKHLFLVSCPTKVDDIFWSGAAFHQFFDQLVMKRNFKRSRHMFFRWRYPFGKKPSAIEFAPRLQIPVSFLVGDRDRLVPQKMSKRVFDSISFHSKSWRCIQTESHADEIFLSDPEPSLEWFREGLILSGYNECE